MFEAITSILSGGLTGILGSAISRYSEFKTRKLELEVELKRGEQDLKQIELESARDVQIAEREAASAELSAEHQALSASHAADSASYLQAAKSGWTRLLMGLVDFVRGLMRPAITIYLIVLTSWIAKTLYDLVLRYQHEAFSATQAFGLWSEVINMVLYLTSAAVLWWFGSRPTRSGK